MFMPAAAPGMVHQHNYEQHHQHDYEQYPLAQYPPPHLYAQMPVRPSFVTRLAKQLGGPLRGAATPIVYGSFVLCMLVFIPVWNCLAMMDDQVFVYVIGYELPWSLIVALACVVALFVMAVLTYSFAPYKVHISESLQLSIFTTFTSLLGIVLMLYAAAYTSGSGHFADDIGGCNLGNARVRDLALEYENLWQVRNSASCMAERSVEGCAGYANTPEARVLRFMEETYLCSGFCHQTPRGANATSVLSSKDFVDAAHGTMPVSLLSEVGSVEVRDAGMAAVLDGLKTWFGGDGSRSSLAPVLDAAVGGAGVTLPFPKTLFSDRNNHGSCHGAAMRTMRADLGDVSTQFMYQGCQLLFVAIITGFLILMDGCCGRDSDDKFANASTAYGSFAAEQDFPEAYEPHTSYVPS
jgi:hypothetical protein